MLYWYISHCMTRDSLVCHFSVWMSLRWEKEVVRSPVMFYWTASLKNQLVLDDVQATLNNSVSNTMWHMRCCILDQSYWSSSSFLLQMFNRPSWQLGKPFVFQLNSVLISPIQFMIHLMGSRNISTPSSRLLSWRGKLIYSLGTRRMEDWLLSKRRGCRLLLSLLQAPQSSSWMSQPQG